MNENQAKRKGFVYILEVNDIDLPVCKIGMTSKNPYERCSDINNSSTGDFIWKVAYYIFVYDCQKLESLLHEKLDPFRQKNREFFNITAEVAYKALLSIMKNQNEIRELPKEEVFETEKKKLKRTPTFRKIDKEYSELLQLFCSLFNCKGRPFGQLNKPYFGISDGKEGVQWNMRIDKENTNEFRLGVNLEGMKYLNWPITTFILSELDGPSIEKLKKELKQQLEHINIQFTRDAWQGTSRPDIKEQYIVDQKISKIDTEYWIKILKEALDCLNKEKHYRGRNKQLVTLANKPKKGEQVKTMEVSPHLTIWTPIELSGNKLLNLENGKKLLEPVHEWTSKVSQT